MVRVYRNIPKTDKSTEIKHRLPTLGEGWDTGFPQSIDNVLELDGSDGHKISWNMTKNRKEKDVVQEEKLAYIEEKS